MAPSAPPPAPPRSQRKAASGVTIKPVVPVLPTSSARSTIVAKEVQPEEENIIPEQPTTTPAAPNAETSKAVDLTEEAGTSVTAVVASSKEPKHKTIPIPPKTVDKKQRPAKLDIAATKDASKKTAEPGIASVEGTKTATKGVDEDSSGIGLSQPATPETAASQASAPSDVRQRQPRTMKVPPLPKPEASSPGMAANLSKEASRRPSFTSIHRPETPTSEKISDTISYTSTSRANSPPPSKAGSVPVRQISKTQQKRERQARAKQAEQIDGSSKAEEPAARVEEVQAPVIGRKKKTRKEMTQGTADSTPTVTQPASPVHKEEFPEDVAAIAPMTPVKNSKKGVSRITAEVKEPDTPSSPATPASVEQQKVALTAAAIFHSMLDAGEINANAKDIFSSVPGLNHRFETLETDFAEDNDSLVSDDQHRLLVQGEAIQIERGPSNHVVMFPDRRALQGLSAAQASRYLELRKQTLVYGDVPSHQALDGLIPAPPTVNVAAVSSIAQRGPKQTNLSNKFQTPAVPTETVGLHKYGSLPGYGDEGSTNRKPTMSLAEAERQLLASKKETEGLEKKLNALLKKNRRLLFGNAH